MRIWYGKKTLGLWALIFMVAVVVPTAWGTVMVGSQKQGIPFVFYEFSSAPPPFFGSTFYPEWFAADLLVYYLAAVLLVFLYERRRRPAGPSARPRDRAS